MDYFWTLWRTCQHHDVLFDVMTYSLMLWRTYWCHDVYFDVMTSFLMLWRMLWHYMTNFTYLWRQGVLFDVMMYLLISWHALRYDIHFDGKVCIFTACRTFWRYDVLYDICFDVMTYLPYFSTSLGLYVVHNMAGCEIGSSRLLGHYEAVHFYPVNNVDRPS